ncbi:MAG: hypothetical protein ACLRMJ_04315 [Alistipes finegoldii]
MGLPHAGTGRRAAALRLRIRLHRRAGGGTAGATWHYIDGAGRTRISCPGCEAVKPFRNGRAPVVCGGRRLEIDREGREFDI